MVRYVAAVSAIVVWTCVLTHACQRQLWAFRSQTTFLVCATCIDVSMCVLLRAPAASSSLEAPNLSSAVLSTAADLGSEARDDVVPGAGGDVAAEHVTGAQEMRRGAAVSSAGADSSQMMPSSSASSTALQEITGVETASRDEVRARPKRRRLTEKQSCAAY